MKFCPNCGDAIGQDETKFCGNCGSSINAPNTAVSQIEATEHEEPSSASAFDQPSDPWDHPDVESAKQRARVYTSTEVASQFSRTGMSWMFMLILVAAFFVTPFSRGFGSPPGLFMLGIIVVIGVFAQAERIAQQ